MPQRVRDVDRLQRRLSLGEPSQKQQVVIGLGAKRESIGVDAVQHGVDDVEACEERACSAEIATNGASGYRRQSASRRAGE
jgi:hypothetical protein